jgi:uncharacterized protein (DUF58 family)
VEIPNVGLIAFQDSESGERIVFDTRSAQARELYAEINRNNAAERQQTLRANQVDFIDIQTDKSYVIPLVRFFRQRAARG